MAKRVAAAPPPPPPPPLPEQQQANKKQKTIHNDSHQKGKAQSSGAAAGSSHHNSRGYASKSGNNNNNNTQPKKQTKPSPQPQKHVVKPKQILSKTQKWAQTNNNKQVQNSPKQNKNANKHPKTKSRKPTLQTMSLADVLPTNLAGGGKGRGVKAPPTSTPAAAAPPSLQSSDFPSLSSATAPPVWPTVQGGSAMAVLKRPTTGPVLPKAKPTAKSSKAAKPASSTNNYDRGKISSQQVPPPDKTPPSSSLMAQFLGARAARTLDDDSMLRFVQQQPTGGIVKGRQRLKPRKKKFSSLKKKVLAERLRQYKAQNEKSEATNDNIPTTNSNTLCLYGFAEGELVQDDDEYEELVTNLADLVDEISTDKRIFIPRNVTGRSPTQYPCFVEFTDANFVSAALSCWKDLLVGGQALSVEPLPVSRGIDNIQEWQARCLEVEESENQVKMKGVESNAPCPIVLTNILTEDDLEDDDCLEEALGDIKAICQDFGEIIDLSLDKEARSVLVTYEGGLAVAKKALAGLEGKVLGGSLIKPVLVSPSHTNENSISPKVILHGILTEYDLDDPECLQETLDDITQMAATYGSLRDIQADKKACMVILVFEGGLDVAQRAVTEFSKKTIGGSQVNATLDLSEESTVTQQSLTVVLKGALTDDDLEDEDCLGESLRDLKELASQFGSIVSIRASDGKVKIECDSRETALSTMTGFNGMIIGGQTIEAMLDNDSISMGVDHDAMKMDKKPLAEPEPLFSGDKRIPDRFAECLRVPKVPVVGGPRKYATLLNDDTVKPLIIEMLGELMRLQKRAIDDKNAKARRRLVMGFREVARGVRARKVKLVVSFLCASLSVFESHLCTYIPGFSLFRSWQIIWMTSMEPSMRSFKRFSICATVRAFLFFLN